MNIHELYNMKLMKKCKNQQKIANKFPLNDVDVYACFGANLLKVE